MGKREKRNKKQPPRPPVGVLDGVMTLLAVVFVAGLRVFAHACVHEDGSVATCATLERVLLAVGALSVALSLARLLSADLHTKRSFDFLMAIAGLVILLTPGNILPLCDDATMVCHTVMQPFARVMGGALIGCSLACELTSDREDSGGRTTRRRRRR